MHKKTKNYVTINHKIVNHVRRDKKFVNYLKKLENLNTLKPKINDLMKVCLNKYNYRKCIKERDNKL